MRGAPEPGFPVAGRLQAEYSFVPVGVVGEANVFDSEILLLLFPLLRPGKVRFIELLAQFGNLNLVGIRKKNSKHGGKPPLRSHPLNVASAVIPFNFRAKI